MQKFLWLIAVAIALFGFYFAYGMTFPEKCTERAMKKYVLEKLGSMTLVQQHDPSTIRSLEIQYIRKYKCNIRTDDPKD